MSQEKQVGISYLTRSESSSGRIFKRQHNLLSISVSVLVSVGGIMVSIAAFQAVDPGSIPGRRNFYVFGKEVFC